MPHTFHIPPAGQPALVTAWGRVTGEDARALTTYLRDAVDSRGLDLICDFSTVEGASIAVADLPSLCETPPSAAVGAASSPRKGRVVLIVHANPIAPFCSLLLGLASLHCRCKPEIHVAASLEQALSMLRTDRRAAPPAARVTWLPSSLRRASGDAAS